MVVEGTLATQDRVRTVGGDLVRLRLALDDRRVDLYGHLADAAAWPSPFVASPRRRLCLRPSRHRYAGSARTSWPSGGR